MSSLSAVLSRHCARRIAIRKAIDLGAELAHALHRNLTRLVLMHRCNSLEDDMDRVRIPRKDLSKCTVGRLRSPAPLFGPTSANQDVLNIPSPTWPISYQPLHREQESWSCLNMLLRPPCFYVRCYFRHGRSCGTTTSRSL